MALTRLRFIATGLVQGVGFRWFVRETAQTLGLVGWVRNCEDGTVEIEAEGAGSALETFAGVLRKPALARVDGLTSEQVAARGEKSFEIRR